LEALGVTDYGIYVVVTGFVTLFGFVKVTLASTMQRYYNYAGTTNSSQGIQEVFSTGCYIHAIIAIFVFLLLESIGVWYMNHLMDIPRNRFSASIFLFQVSSVSLIFTIIQIPFVGLILSQEKMGLYSVVCMMDVTLKLLSSLLIFKLPYDSIKVYGLLLLCVSFIDFILYAGYVFKKYPSIHFSLQIDRSMMHSLLKFTGWNLLGTFAFMLRGQGISLLLNYFFGPIVNAARGIAMQVSNAINGFSNNITVAFTPQIVNAVAAENNQRARSMMFFESRICYALILLITIPMCLEINYILKIWLGVNVPIDTDIFTILMLIDTTFCTLNTPCTQITLATGKIRNYQIGSIIVNLSLIPVCYMFLKIGFSAISSFVITIVFSVINQIICLYNTNKVFRLHFPDYLRSVAVPCFICTMLLPVLPFLVRNFLEPSIFRVILTCFVDLLVGVPLFYLILFNQNERTLLKEHVISKLNNRREL
jgi:O-antigen/teichoic acid export membrane protein